MPRVFNKNKNRLQQSVVMMREPFTQLLINVGLIEGTINMLMEAISFPVSWTAHISQMLYALIVLFILLDMAVNKNNHVAVFTILAIFIILIFISSFLTPEICVIRKITMITFFSACLPGFYLGRNMIKCEKLVMNAKPYIIISIACLALIELLGKDTNGMYFITYSFLPSALFSILIALKEKSVLYFLIFIYLVSEIFMIGARGPILCIMIFVVTLITFGTKNKIVKTSIILIAILFSSVIMFFSKGLIAFLFERFPDLRMTQFLSNGDVFDFSTRQDIFTYGWDFILKDPWKIRGLLADRVFYTYNFIGTNKLGAYVNESMISGLYAHNIWLELSIEFGILFGTAIIIVIGCIIIKSIINTKRDKLVTFVYILIATIGIVPLFFSFSYLTYDLFWLLLGLSINITYRKSIAARKNFAEKSWHASNKKMRENI